MTRHFNMTAIFQSEPEGGYTVTIPFFPGVVSFGQTVEEAEKNIHEAVSLHIENLKTANTGFSRDAGNQILFQ